MRNMPKHPEHSEKAAKYWQPDIPETAQKSGKLPKNRKNFRDFGTLSNCHYILEKQLTRILSVEDGFLASFPGKAHIHQLSYDILVNRGSGRRSTRCDRLFRKLFLALIQISKGKEISGSTYGDIGDHWTKQDTIATRRQC